MVPPIARRVVLTTRAIADVSGAFEWYELQRPTLGSDFLTALDRAMDELRTRSLTGRGIRGRLRRQLLRRFPYSVFYVLGEAEITVLAVIHSRRVLVQIFSR